MNKIENNIPAFPIDAKHIEGGVNADYAGMTLLDYFAGKAIQGLLINRPSWSSGNMDLASEAYGIASQMLEVRKNYIP